MIRTLSQCIDCSFARLQFTPDLLPADIMGTKIFNQKDASFSTIKGPAFVHFVLADEINRAPPKVQSALCRGHAGEAGDHPGRDPSPCPPVLCACHPEPYRI
ncbi:MAG: AAA family ATPase [Desulfobacterales bacterium]|nr:AAA family ATPase [Desulfobacterales bacterium]